MVNTSLNFWIGAVAAVLIFSTIILSVGVGLQNHGTTLDSDSTDYINAFSGRFEGNFSEVTSAEYQDGQNPLVEDNSTGGFLDFEQLAAVQFFIEKAGSIWNFLKFMYRIPSFILAGFGLPVGAFSQIINIIGVVIGLLIVIMLVRLVR